MFGSISPPINKRKKKKESRTIDKGDYCTRCLQEFAFIWQRHQ
jgi:hypothetical protein